MPALPAVASVLRWRHFAAALLFSLATAAPVGEGGAAPSRRAASKESVDDGDGPWRVQAAYLCDPHMQQTEYGKCPGVPSMCGECAPKDCELGDWSDWASLGYCIGLCERSRPVLQPANECGMPCNGSLAETKDCRDEVDWQLCVMYPVDCQWKDWSAWTECTDEQLGQKFRQRRVVRFPQAGGKPCEGVAKEAAPCGNHVEPIDCELAPWSKWSPCSASCGGGRRSRMRRHVREAQHGGKPCEGTVWENRECNHIPCGNYKDCILGDWSDWAGCTQRHPHQQVRERAPVQDAVGGGEACKGSLLETKACSAPFAPRNCSLTHWSEWQECSASCGGGQQLRVRHVKEQADTGGQCPATILRDLRACNTLPCHGNTSSAATASTDESASCALSEWSEWSPCSATCGAGMKRRTRQAPDEACPQAGGLEEVMSCLSSACPVDCRWGTWEAWSSCSATCGGGIKRRRRMVELPPRNGGTPCLPESMAEVGPCGTAPCESCIDAEWGEWSAWTTCSATCGQGYRSSTRAVVQQPSKCGKHVVGESKRFEVCTLQPCPEKDCELGDWAEWSNCSSKCSGIKERHRAISQYASNGGKPCIAEGLLEVSSCNPGRDEKAPSECPAEVKPCKLSDWSDWGPCPATCGGAQRKRTRQISEEGNSCGPRTETEECAVESCDCQDCKWNSWSDWSECTGCEGQKQRHRSIERLPNYCGKPCEMAAASEITSCTGQCNETRWCAWSRWSLFGECAGDCKGRQTRQRVLQKLEREPRGGHEAYLFRGGLDMDCSNTQLETVPCQVPQGFLSISLLNVKFNNLGGSGPNLEDPAELRFSRVGKENGEELDLVMEAVRNYNPPNNGSANGVDAHQFGIISLGGGAKADFNVYLVEADTNRPVVTKKFYFSFHDLDQPDEHSRKELYIMGYSKYFVTPGSEVEDVKIGKKRGAFASKSVGDEEDNPIDPTEQGNRSVTFLFENTSHFTFSLLFNPGPSKVAEAATFMFSGAHPAEVPNKDCQLGCTPKECAWNDWGDWAAWRSAISSRGFSWSDWGAWSEWGDARRLDKSTPPSLGLCERRRTIKQPANECGKPCTGAASATRHCSSENEKPQDCTFTEWAPWSSCSAGTSSVEPPTFQTRARSVDRPALRGGRACNDSLVEVQPCNSEERGPEECVLSEWASWQDCTRKCGGGWSTRHRFLIRPARPGGRPCSGILEDLRPCGDEPCEEGAIDCEVGDWEDWASCHRGQTQRSRHIAKDAADGGRECNNSLKEVKPCEEEELDCKMSDWSPLEECSRSCGGGEQRFHRRIRFWPTAGGKECNASLMKFEKCNTQPCAHSSQSCPVSDWTAWAPCSSSCGAGIRTRQRDVLPGPDGSISGGCQLALKEVVPCKDLKPCRLKDCTWNDWEEWTPCSASCGGGQRARRRRPLHGAEMGGKPCSVSDMEQQEPCNTGTCNEDCADGKWKDWTSWGQCSRSCGGGLTMRFRQSTPPSPTCGRPATGPAEETKSCNHLPCASAKDCVFGQWGPWAECQRHSAKSCHGFQERSRPVAQQQEGDGMPCSGPEVERKPCQFSPTCLTSGEKADCTFSDWSAWGNCTASCGGGHRNRTRFVILEAQNGGRPCDGPINETGKCTTAACPEPCKPTNCEWGDWGNWTSCNHCGDTRHRSRHIKEEPHCGGEGCPAMAVREVGDCSALCRKDAMCSWGDWLDWGSCSRTCGPGHRARSRFLRIVPSATDESTELWAKDNPRPGDGGASLHTGTLGLSGHVGGVTPHHRQRGMAIAFACGCLCLLALASLSRLATRSGGARRSRQGYEQLFRSAIPRSSGDFVRIVRNW